MMPPSTWQVASRRVAAADIALAITVRSIGALPMPVPLAVDHVDALSLNMLRRSRGPERLPVRLVARIEARLLRRWERRVGRHAAVQVVTAVEDAEALPFGPTPLVLPVALDTVLATADTDAMRDIDVIFTGTALSAVSARQRSSSRSRSFPLSDVASRPCAPSWPGVAPIGSGSRRIRASSSRQTSRISMFCCDVRRWPSRHCAAALGPLTRCSSGSQWSPVVATPWVAERFWLSLAVGQHGDALADEVVRLAPGRSLCCCGARPGRGRLGTSRRGCVCPAPGRGTSRGGAARALSARAAPTR